MNEIQQIALENFDETQYLRLNPDISDAVARGDFESGWDHYQRYGKAENRPGAVKQYASFDETQYLRLNPDISDAVARGDFESGWDHYSRYRNIENRPGAVKQYATVDLLSGNTNSIPVPPPDLRARVHGAEELAAFHKIGEVVAGDLEGTIKSLDLELNDRSNILDFGCGCGRIISWFQDLHPKSKFYGTDIDGEAITWCQENLAAWGNFSVNDAMPPLSYPDQFFDLLYSISIFTHLPEEMQFAWLQELQRVCKPGAYLLLTVHGEHLFPKNAESAKIEFENNGFYYWIEKYSNGLPEFYQTSFHTETYIRDRWSKFFEIEQIVPKGIANHQDLIICKNTRS
ncbi:MAG: class I SAM-dependent methyltransferase [Cyanobacteria bacterium P01_E01_bin.35]